jgi:site-specific DNA recombinase
VDTAHAAIRCAIYTRKSTDEGLDQAFNTLDAQREAGEAYVASQRHEGWIATPQHYDDGGFTGANMDRPALKRLLADVEAGVVNCVVVYKVDRLTRSLLDFARIVEVFDKSGVTFVSVTQQFNTTASIGRLTLNILLSFAQFEREMISERTRDKMRAARRKGKFVGGNLILGFDVTSQGGSLVVNEAEAQRVRAIFQLYLDYGTLIPVVEELNRRGWTLKSWVTREGRQVGGTCFTKSKVYNLLTNYAYVGKVRYEGKVLEGEHELIVDNATFERVQELLRHNGRGSGRTLRHKYTALLKGLVRCGTCGTTMVHTYTEKGPRLYRYYVCTKAQQQGWNRCATRSVSAPALEAAVVEQIRSIGRSPALLAQVLRKLAGDAHARSDEAQRQLGQVDKELSEASTDMAALATRASTPGADAKEALDRLARLHARVAELEQQRAGVLRTSRAEHTGTDANDVQHALEQFSPLWDEMTGWEQQKVIRSLIEEVRYDGEAGVVKLGFRSNGLKEVCQNVAARLD